MSPTTASPTTAYPTTSNAMIETLILALDGDYTEFVQYLEENNTDLFDSALSIIQTLMNLDNNPVLQDVIVNILNVTAGSIIIEYTLKTYNMDILDQAILNMNDATNTDIIAGNFTFGVLSNMIITPSPTTAIPTPSPTTAIPTFSNYVAVELVSDSLDNNICNNGQIVLELHIDTANTITYDPFCDWKGWVNNTSMTHNDLLSIISASQTSLNELNQCYLRINGENLQRNVIYTFEACKVIENIERCDNNTLNPIYSLTIPVIDAFAVIPDENNIYALNISSPIGINITSSTFHDANTIYTAYSLYNTRFESTLTFGTRNKMMTENIILTENKDDNNLMNITVCGLDTNQCRSCFTKYVEIKENIAIQNDPCALKESINNITDYAETANNTNLLYTTTAIQINSNDSNNECVKDIQQQQFDLLTDLIQQNSNNTQFLEQSTKSMEQFLSEPEVFHNINQSIVEVQDTIQILSKQIESTEEAQNVLSLSNKLVSNVIANLINNNNENNNNNNSNQNQTESIEIEVTEELCDVTDKTRNMAESMTNKIVADNAANSELIEINGPIISSFGMKNDKKSGLSLTHNTGSFSIELAPSTNTTSSSQQRQLSAVSFQASFAQTCIERSIGNENTQNKNTQNSVNNQSDTIDSGQFILGTQFVNITLNDGDDLEDGELITITLRKIESDFNDIDVKNILNCFVKIWTFWSDVEMNLCSISDDNIAVFINEMDGGSYSEYGITMKSTSENNITFNVNHLTAFAVAKKIKIGKDRKNNRLQHVLLGFVSIMVFIVLLIAVSMSICFDGPGIYGMVRKKNKITDNTLRLMSISLIFHVLNELVLIIFYSINSSKGDVIENVFIFFVLLPLTIHFWIFMIAIFSWLKIYFSSSMTKTRKDIKKLRWIFIVIVIGFTILIFIASLFIITINDDGLVSNITDIFGLIMGFCVLIVGIITKLVSIKLVNYIKETAKRANSAYNLKIVNKLTITGTLITASFVSYSFVTIISVLKHDTYLEYDYLYELIIKLCDIISISTIFYLYMDFTQMTQSSQKNRMKLDANVGSVTSGKTKTRRITKLARPTVSRPTASRPTTSRPTTLKISRTRSDRNTIIHPSRNRCSGDRITDNSAKEDKTNVYMNAMNARQVMLSIESEEATNL